MTASYAFAQGNGTTKELKPHQFVTPGPPPAPPSKFNPDFGAPPPRTNLAPEKIVVQPQMLTNAVPPPKPPPIFNPNPGASLKPPVPDTTPFFTNAIAAPPAFEGEPVPEDLLLPRSSVRRPQVEVTNVPSGTYGSEPLPPALELPREDARGQKYIHGKWHLGHAHEEKTEYENPPFTEPVPDRWRIGFAPWRRYTAGDIEQPFESPKPKFWHPYHQSVLKGDAPLIGQDIFLNLIATSDTIFEARRVPTPSGVSGAQANNAEFFGRSEQFTVIQNFGFAAELFRGYTVFQPVHWAVLIQPVFNVNFNYVREAGVLKPDPRGPDAPSGSPPGSNSGVTNPGDVDGVTDGVTPAPNDLEGRNHTTRTDDYIALQQYSVEIHLRDLSDNYDFIATRIGNQIFNSDFRGFIFNDVNLGWRIFGNYDNNRWQYNVVAFDMREKDTNSELNRFSRRDQYVIIANLYRQDFLWHGYTAQWSFHANLDGGEMHYDRNGFLTRPAPLGTVIEHDVNAYYLGWTGDGHIGRWNLSHAFYYVFGNDELNGIAGREVDIGAHMAALELSYDHDWIRYKASVFYASGDPDAEDDEANGFDVIVDNANFTGGPFSWYMRQGFNLAGSSVGVKQRNSLFANLRTSKTEGQANFVNPGVLLASLGAEIEVTPRLRSFLNFNYVRFMETDPLKTTLLTDEIAHELGFDLSIGFQYRPLLTDNIIISAGFGGFIPGQGFKDIYQSNPDPVPGLNDRGDGDVDDFLYSGLIAITFTY